MIRIFSAALLLGLSAPALALPVEDCRVYTSTSRPDGERVIAFPESTEMAFVIRENGEEEDFIVTGTGTGRSEVVAVSEDAPGAEINQIAWDGEMIALGEERFKPFCQ